VNFDALFHVLLIVYCVSGIGVILFGIAELILDAGMPADGMIEYCGMAVMPILNTVVLVILLWGLRMIFKSTK
jgi:hypothetical protein